MIAAVVFEDLAGGLLSGLAYCGVGLLVLILGVVMVDLLTPGKLTDLIYKDRNWNAAIVVAANIASVGSIVTTAIATSDDDLAKGLIDAVSYGLLGVVILSIAFVILDRLTPGHLGTLIVSDKLHPAILVTAATTLVIGAVVSVSIA